MRRELQQGVLWMVLCGLAPVLAAGFGAENPNPSRAESFLAPDAVRAAFASNLAGDTGRSFSSPREPGNAAEVEGSPNSDGLPRIEIAALFGQELPSLFQANLTEPIQRALTPPIVSVTPEALSLTATVGAASTRHRLQITSLGATVNWKATARTLSGAGWLNILPETGTVTSTTNSVLGVEVKTRKYAGSAALPRRTPGRAGRSSG